MLISIAHNDTRKGQMTLPFILLVSGIIIEIAIAGAFVTYFLSTSGYGERLAVRAEAAARSGVNDALVRIMQNKNFSSASCDSPYEYSLSVGGGDISSVSLCRTTDFSTNTYTFTITSLGIAGMHQKKFVAIAVVDQTTGQTALESISERAVE